jgi:hypothetical protein
MLTERPAGEEQQIIPSKKSWDGPLKSKNSKGTGEVILLPCNATH